jgi:hypothetical protein
MVQSGGAGDVAVDAERRREPPPAASARSPHPETTSAESVIERQIAAERATAPEGADLLAEDGELE